MQNKHTEYIKISDNKKTACLMVHGIVGSPRYFDKMIPLLPEDWSIYNILLDGHGGGTKDFAATSLEKWRKQVGEYISYLQKEYENIYVFAHSLGTLLTMEAVVEKPYKIKNMFLFAIPLAPRVKFKSFVNAVRSALDMKTPKSDMLDAKNQYSISTDRKIWRYIGFIPRFIDLLIIVKEMRKKISLLYVPTDAFLHKKDELVSPKAEKYIRKNERIKLHCLDNSYHNIISEEDFEKIKKIIEKRLTD